MRRIEDDPKISPKEGTVEQRAADLFELIGDLVYKMYDLGPDNHPHSQDLPEPESDEDSA